MLHLLLENLLMRKSEKMIEEKIEFQAKNVFYNEEMRFCRSIFSLAVGAIDEQIALLDAFCASGTRGIRYAKENKNVKSSIFLDWSENCIKLAKENAKKNKVKKAKMIREDVNKFLVNNFHEEKAEFNFVELDPFGTPTPYLYPTFYSMQKCKTFYLSATATDTAVLCGPEKNACLKNYHSKNLNNEFTHENGLRILIKRIAESAAEFNFGIEPLFSISDRHYLKTIIKCENNAIKADESMAKLGYVSYCSACAWRTSSKRAEYKCENCSKATEIGGPMWLGETSSKKFVEKMILLNDERKYEDKNEIGKKLELIKNEYGLPVGYYNVHVMCKRKNTKSVPKMDIVIEKLQENKFIAIKTHYSPVSIKTNAGIREIESAISESLKR